MSLESRPEYQVVLEVGFVSLLAVASAILNVISCVIIWKNTLLRTWHNLFTINLIIIDLVSVVCSMISSSLVLAYGEWITGHIMCHFSGYINAVLASVIINTLALFSFSRYQLFVHPRRYLMTWNKKTCLIAIGSVWVVAFVISSPPLFGWGNYTFLPKNAVCFLDFNSSRTFSSIYVYVFLAVPLICAVVYLVRLHIALRNDRRYKIARQANNTAQFRQPLRAARSMLALALSFLFCWMPAFVVFGLDAFNVYLSRGLCLFSTLMIYIFGLILPLIYAATSSVFKVAWRRQFRLKRIIHPSSVKPVESHVKSGVNLSLRTLGASTHREYATYDNGDAEPPNFQKKLRK